MKWTVSRAAFVTVTWVTAGCVAPTVDPGDRGLAPVYDASSGRLTELSHDRDRDGRYESKAFMDGSRVVRVEIDENADGRPDRFEYYDGVQAAPTPAPAGARAPAPGDAAPAVRIERSLARDGRVTRWERYEKGELVSVEVDRDGNGAVDRWETYVNGGLATAAFDTRGRGEPDQRLVYDADGNARVEALSPEP
jgi:hypothetical protein